MNGMQGYITRRHIAISKQQSAGGVIIAARVIRTVAAQLGVPISPAPRQKRSDGGGSDFRAIRDREIT
jgi:hypothetical protein